MAMDQGHNGYENYATWCVSLWLTNEYHLYVAAQENAESIEELQEFVLTLLPEMPGMFSDLVSHVLAHVNWIEVQEAVLPEGGSCPKCGTTERDEERDMWYCPCAYEVAQ